MPALISDVPAEDANNSNAQLIVHLHNGFIIWGYHLGWCQSPSRQSSGDHTWCRTGSPQADIGPEAWFILHRSLVNDRAGKPTRAALSGTPVQLCI